MYEMRVCSLPDSLGKKWFNLNFKTLYLKVVQPPEMSSLPFLQNLKLLHAQTITLPVLKFLSRIIMSLRQNWITALKQHSVFLSNLYNREQNQAIYFQSIHWYKFSHDCLYKDKAIIFMYCKNNFDIWYTSIRSIPKSMLKFSNCLLFAFSNNIKIRRISGSY